MATSLNAIGYCTAYQQHARAAFAPNWAQTTATAPGSAAVRVADATAITTQPADAGAAPAPQTTVADALSRAGLKPDYADLYVSVQARTGTPWQLLAAVHKVETGQSGDTAITSYAGATGPMQFMPATFAHYALVGDGDGTMQINGLCDSMLTAGRYLAAGGADKGKYSAALYNYNHSNAYVSKVLNIARRLGLN